MQTLEGRTCLFAGATGGDGVSAVKALCAGGMNVVMLTHNVEHAERLAAEIKAMGLPGECTYSTGPEDGRTAEESPEAYEEAVAKYGCVDVIINNTGANGHIDDIDTLTPEEFQRNVDHLLIGSFKMLKTALPFLRKSRCPRVILMTTAEGVRGGTHESLANAVGKGAVKALTLNAAARLAREGITVNCVAKGAIPGIEPLRPHEPDPKDRLSVIPMGRLGSPDDLANAICFLASEESSYITGQILEVSGGLNLGR